MEVYRLAALPSDDNFDDANFERVCVSAVYSIHWQFQIGMARGSKLFLCGSFLAQLHLVVVGASAKLSRKK